MLDVEQFFRLGFAPHLRNLFNHRLLFGTQWQRFRIIVDLDFIAIV
jgi:hypothetical protein